MDLIFSSEFVNMASLKHNLVIRWFLMWLPLAAIYGGSTSSIGETEICLSYVLEFSLLLATGH